jgi:hypothetical protein
MRIFTCILERNEMNEIQLLILTQRLVYQQITLTFHHQFSPYYHLRVRRGWIAAKIVYRSNLFWTKIV